MDFILTILSLTVRALASLIKPGGKTSIRLSRLRSNSPSNFKMSCCLAKNPATKSPKTPPKAKKMLILLLYPLPALCFSLLSFSAVMSLRSSGMSLTLKLVGVDTSDGEGGGEPNILRLKVDISGLLSSAKQVDLLPHTADSELEIFYNSPQQK